MRLYYSKHCIVHWICIALLITASYPLFAGDDSTQDYDDITHNFVDRDQSSDYSLSSKTISNGCNTKKLHYFLSPERA